MVHDMTTDGADREVIHTDKHIFGIGNTCCYDPPYGAEAANQCRSDICGYRVPGDRHTYLTGQTYTDMVDLEIYELIEKPVPQQATKLNQSQEARIDLPGNTIMSQKQIFNLMKKEAFEKFNSAK